MAKPPPACRRPIADVFRKTAHFAVRFCIAKRIHPNTISYTSILAAALAGVCLILAHRLPVLLLIAPLFLLLRLWCNMLDGMVAISSGQSSPKGEIINELPDRISDILIFTTLAHSQLANPFLGYWAALLAVMTAYIATLGQTVTGRRTFIGMMSKQWRMLTLILALWATWLVHLLSPRFLHIGPLTLLDCALILIILGCLQTCIARLRIILSDLDSNPDSGA